MIEELEDMIWVRLLRSCYNCQTWLLSKAAGEDYTGYHKANGVESPLLEHIIIFRDGVSEGEYDRVLEMEIKQIESRLFFLSTHVPD